MSKAPTHTIFAVEDQDALNPQATPGQVTGWTPVGVAWSHAGGGFGIAFDSKRVMPGVCGTELVTLPRGCRIVARPRPTGGQQ